MECRKITNDNKIIKFNKTTTNICYWNKTFWRQLIRIYMLINQLNSELNNINILMNIIVKVNNILEKTIDKSIFVNVMKMICTGFNQTCPLFTPNGKLISYDGAHLTKYGALYIGNIIFKNKPLNKLL